MMDSPANSSSSSESSSSGYSTTDDIDGINTILVRICINDGGVQVSKCLVFDQEDSVWAARTIVLDKLAKDLPNALNYGLYLPVEGAKAGKFMEEDRTLSEYHLTEAARLDFRFKSRDYRGRTFDEKLLAKANSRAKQVKFLEMVQKCQIEKLAGMLEKGLDPNFALEEFGGESAVGLASQSQFCREILLVLVNGGAHIDFRNAHGSTAIHTAAKANNYRAVQTLLELGVSPNYRDAKGLTPLYNTCLPSGGGAEMALLLLRERSQMMVSDTNGWQEIHQACRNGLQRHLDHLLFYGADIHAQNSNGSTALHVCGIHGQVECARILLFRGAKKSVANKANHAPQQDALLAGNTEVAELVQNYEQTSSIPKQEKPTYNSPKRGSISGGSIGSPRLCQRAMSSRRVLTKAAKALMATAEQASGPSSPVSPESPTRTKLGYDSQVSGDSGRARLHNLDEDNGEDLPPLPRAEPKAAKNTVMTQVEGPSSFPSPLNADVVVGDAKTMKVNIPGSPSSTCRRGSSSSGGSGGGGGKNADMSRTSSSSSTNSMGKSPNADTLRPKKFVRVNKPEHAVVMVATDEFLAHELEELPFMKGDKVEVLHYGKDGWWEGQSRGRRGWFPSILVTTSSSSNGKPQDGAMADGGSPVKADQVEFRPVNIILVKCPQGLGFSLKGAKSQEACANFKPTPEVPALQYIGNVDSGSVAERAGLKKGDLLLTINEKDVTSSSHTYAVSLIKQSGKIVTMTVARQRSGSGPPSRRGSLPVDGSPLSSRHNSLSRRPENTISNPSSPGTKRSMKQRVAFQVEEDPPPAEPDTPQIVPLAPKAPVAPIVPSPLTLETGNPSPSPPASPKSIRAPRPPPLAAVGNAAPASEKLPQSPLAFSATPGFGKAKAANSAAKHTVGEPKPAESGASRSATPPQVTASSPAASRKDVNAADKQAAAPEAKGKKTVSSPPANGKPDLSLGFLQQLINAPSAMAASSQQDKGNATHVAAPAPAASASSHGAGNAPQSENRQAADKESSKPAGKDSKPKMPASAGPRDLTLDVMQQLNMSPTALKTNGVPPVVSAVGFSKTSRAVKPKSASPALKRSDSRDRPPPVLSVPPAPPKSPSNLSRHLPKASAAPSSSLGDALKAPVLNRLNVELEDEDASGYARIKDKAPEDNVSSSSEAGSNSASPPAPPTLPPLMPSKSANDVFQSPTAPRASQSPGPLRAKSCATIVAKQSPSLPRAAAVPAQNKHQPAEARPSPVTSRKPENLVVAPPDSSGKVRLPAVTADSKTTDSSKPDETMPVMNGTAKTIESADAGESPLYAAINKPAMDAASPKLQLLRHQPSPTSPVAPDLPPKLDDPKPEKPLHLPLDEKKPPSPPPPSRPPITDEQRQENASRIAEARQKHQQKRASLNLTSPVTPNAATLVNAAAAKKAEEDKIVSFNSSGRRLLGGSPPIAQKKRSPLGSPTEIRSRSKSLSAAKAMQMEEAPPVEIASHLALLVARVKAREERVETGQAKSIDALQEEKAASSQTSATDGGDSALWKKTSKANGAAGKKDRPQPAPKPKPASSEGNISVRQQKPKERAGEPSLLQTILSARSQSPMSPMTSSILGVDSSNSSSSSSSSTPTDTDGLDRSVGSSSVFGMSANTVLVTRSPSTHSMDKRQAWEDLDTPDDPHGPSIVPNMFADDDTPAIPDEWGDGSDTEDSSGATESTTSERPANASPPVTRETRSSSSPDPIRLSSLISTFVPPPLSNGDDQHKDEPGPGDAPPPAGFSTPPAGRSATPLPPRPPIPGKPKPSLPAGKPKHFTPSPKLKKSRTSPVMQRSPLVDSPRASPKFHVPPPPVFSPPVTPAAPPPAAIASDTLDTASSRENGTSKARKPSSTTSSPALLISQKAGAQESAPSPPQREATNSHLKPPMEFGDSEDVPDDDQPPALPSSLPPDLEIGSDVEMAEEDEAGAPGVPPSFLDSPGVERSTSLKAGDSSDASVKCPSPLLGRNQSDDPPPRRQPSPSIVQRAPEQSDVAAPTQSEIGSLAALDAVVSQLDLSSGLHYDDDADDDDDDSSADKSGPGEPAFKAKPVVEWSCNDVADWLCEIGLGQYGSSFVDNEICGEHLAEMNKDDLRELGIVRLGHRLTITNALSKVQS